MAHRLTASLVAAAAVLAAAPAAHARLAYVKRPSSAHPRVWVARDDGSHARPRATGMLPVVSPDGRRLAWQRSGADGRIRVMLGRATGHGARRVARSGEIGGVAFSPDGRKLAIAVRSKLKVLWLHGHRTRVAARGHVRGFSFAPDSRRIVYGTSGSDGAFDAPSDLYIRDLRDGQRFRVTRDRRSLNPLWGPAGDIVFDRQTDREGDAPTYNLFAVHPDGGAYRRVTALKIPALLSGLVPLEMSDDGTRLLAEFVGQDTSAAFTVDPAGGDTSALADAFETGLVAAGLSADGRTVLGMTGGPDPGGRHDVVTLRYGGGHRRVLVRHAAYPAWSR